MWIWRRMENISWPDKVTDEEVLRGVNESSQLLDSIWQRKHQWIGHVLRHDWLLHEIVERCEVIQQKGWKEFKCYMIWQMMMGMLHSDGQQRTEKEVDTEKGCQNPALQQKTTVLLMQSEFGVTGTAPLAWLQMSMDRTQFVKLVGSACHPLWSRPNSIAVGQTVRAHTRVEIRRKKWAPRIRHPVFKVFQGHRNWHESIEYIWLPISDL